jgi:hypothetical protein
VAGPGLSGKSIWRPDRHHTKDVTLCFTMLSLGRHFREYPWKYARVWRGAGGPGAFSASLVAQRPPVAPPPGGQGSQGRARREWGLGPCARETLAPAGRGRTGVCARAQTLPAGCAVEKPFSTCLPSRVRAWQLLPFDAISGTVRMTMR